MTAVAERITKEALTLSPMERADLMHRLFISFDPPPAPSIDDAWKNEVDSQYEALNRGEIETYSPDDVFKEIFSS